MKLQVIKTLKNILTFAVAEASILPFYDTTTMIEGWCQLQLCQQTVETFIQKQVSGSLHVKEL